MRFDVITIFPQMIDSYLGESILKRAREKKIILTHTHDLRDFSADEKHKKVDDRPYGGGAGMALGVEPIARALQKILGIRNPRSRASSLRGRQESGIRKRTAVILFSASGKQFTQKMASEWAKKCDRLVLIAGRYEGVDERIKSIIRDSKFILREVSIGPYVLTGGELPALVVIDAVSRHIPGVLGSHESLEEKRHGIGVSVYTRPEVFIWRGKKYRVPKVLLSGDQKKVAEWRSKN